MFFVGDERRRTGVVFIIITCKKNLSSPTLSSLRLHVTLTLCSIDRELNTRACAFVTVRGGGELCRRWKIEKRQLFVQYWYKTTAASRQ